MFAPREPALAPSYAVDRLAEAVGELAGREVALERPKDASLGDYATNVALQSAKELGRPPREIAEELAAKLVELPRGRERRGRGAGLPEPPARRRVLRRGARGDRRGLRRRLGRARRSGSRSSSSRRTRPARSRSRRRATARTATASPGCSSSPGHDVEREYYFNDAGRADGPLPRLGRGGAARRGAARGRLPRRRTSPTSPASRAIRCRAMLERIEATLAALPHPLRLVGRTSSPRATSPAAIARAARHVRGRRHALGAHDATTATTKDRVPLLRSSDGSTPLLRGRRRVPARQVRARLRPRDLRPRRRPPRLRRAAGRGRARCSATTPTASRCCSTSSCT